MATGNEQGTLPPPNLSVLLDAAGAGWWIFDRDRWALRLGGALGESLGRGLPAPIGKALGVWRRHVHPDDRVRLVQRLGVPGTVADCEFRYERPDGEWRRLVARWRNEYARDGRLLRRVGTLEDITERRHEATLHRLQRAFSQVLDGAPDRPALFVAIVDAVLGLPEFDAAGFYWQQPDGGFRLATSRGFSPQFLAAVAYFDADSSPAAMVRAGREVCSCIDAGETCNDAALIRTPYLAAEGLTAVVALPVEVGGRYVASLNLASRHARRIPVLTVQLLASLARQFGRALEQLQSREALRIERENLVGLFAAMEEFVFILDRDGRILYVNPRVYERLGYDATLLGRSLVDLHRPQDRECAEEIVAATIAGGDTRCPLPLLCADGREIPVETRVVTGTWDGRPALIAIARDMGEHIVARERLRRSEAQLRAERDLFVGGPVGVVVWGLLADDWTIEYASPNIGSILGHARDDLMSAEFRYSRCVHPDDKTAVLAESTGYRADPLRGSWEQHYRVVGADGGVRWLRDFTVAERDAGGVVVRLRGYVLDMTDERMANLALARTKQQLEFAIEGSGAGLWELDLRSGTTAHNERWATMLGYTLRELEPLTYATFQRLCHPDDYPVAELALAEHIGGAAPRYTAEVRLRHRDGHWVWVLTQAKLVERDADGTPLRIAGTNLDISARKAMEAELARHRHHLEELVRERTAELETVNRQLRTSDMRLKALFEMSESADRLGERELLQLGIEEAVRLTESEIGYLHLVNDDQETLQLYTWSAGTLAHCTATHETHYPVQMAGIWADTLRLRAPVVHNDYSAAPNRRGYPAGHAVLKRHLGVPVIEKDKVRVLLGVGNKAAAYDASDVDELQLIGNDLWRIVMRRRAESQLELARDAAEEASRAKSSFLASMSHEIRTPMNAIIGLAHLVRADATEPAQQQRLAKIADAATHLLGVINDILDIARIEAGRLTLDVGDFDLDRVLETVHTLTGRMAADKGIEIVYDVDPELAGPLRGDAQRLGQVLLNLVGNAVKFTDRGAIVVRARIVDDIAAGIRVRFEVEDPGIGIAPEVMARLFTAFERADSSPTRRHGGTGLGLAICRHLVEIMDGEIGARSEPAVGSTFWFTARLAHGSERPPATPAPPAGSSGRALVVEPLAPAREALARMLAARGYAVDATDTPADAATRLREAGRAGVPVDLVIVSWPPRERDDRQAAAGWLRQPVPPGRVIAAVAGGMSMTPELADAGVETVLAKPVTATALDAVLRAGMPGAPTALTPARPQASPGAVTFSPCRILLVEDNPVNRDVALELLRGVGLDADTAVDGLQALDRARRTRYDLVLMDVQMPVMDGLAATRELRRLPGWAKVPILAMTANAFAEDRDRCLAVGMDDYVAKPVVPERLYATLDRWLNARPERPIVPPRAADRSDPLAAIEGLDAAAGLSNVRGNVETYHRLLRLYTSMHRDDVERWRRLRETGDRDAARRLAHSLKGSAGVLGITGVQRHAASLEAAMRADVPDPDLDALASRLESEQARVLDAVATALGG
jgi:PAS domain S-box-containing protein